MNRGTLRARGLLAGIAVAGLTTLGVSQTAFAGLQIDLVYIETPSQPGPPLVEGAGQLRDIMRVAAESWERIFKRGGGNWKLTIEYGWGRIGPQLFAQEYKVSEGGNNPARINHSCILFNTHPPLEKPLLGFFADPTPWENSEFREYATQSIPTDVGWVNIGRTFAGPTGHAIDRIDMLQVALHEIGHALGFDDEYSGLRNQFPGSGQFSIKAPRPYAGFTVFIGAGHIADLLDFPLMIYSAPMGTRQLISVADTLVISQFSLFDRPDLSEPSLDFNGDGQGIPTRSVSTSSTCVVRPPNPNDGQW